MEIEKITTGKMNNNTFVVCNKNNECIIVDCSCSLEDIIKRVKNCKVLGVLLTHGHYDHFVFIESVLNHFDVKCYISNLELEKLYSPKMNYSIVFNKIYSVKLDETHFETLNNNSGEFKLGEFDISYYLTPGHTNGSVCYFVNNEALFTGDTLFARTCGRTDLITGSEEEMIKSLNFLRKKFLGMKIYPGHGSNGVVEEHF